MSIYKITVAFVKESQLIPAKFSKLFTKEKHPPTPNTLRPFIKYWFPIKYFLASYFNSHYSDWCSCKFCKWLKITEIRKTIKILKIKPCVLRLLLLLEKSHHQKLAIWAMYLGTSLLAHLQCNEVVYCEKEDKNIVSRKISRASMGSLTTNFFLQQIFIRRFPVTL